MPGLWSTPTIAPSFNVGTMLLLTDGTVLAQDSGTSNWWRLSPDQTGHYLRGTWRRTSRSRTAPLNFASAVLKDGRVLVAGGEYANGQPADLCTAELYDPVAELWSDLPVPAGWTAIGDAPCCVLPNGQMLLGSISDNRCALFDSATSRWTATGDKQNQTSTEETWTLLPDGSVLTADCHGHPHAELYVDGRWLDNGTTGVDLVEDASKEIGPAVLLADGRVLAIGATGATALFTPSAQPGKRGAWTAGPSFPVDGGGQLGAKDAPACLLPNGRVLCVAGPVDGTAATYSGPTLFFEFDPLTDMLAKLPVQPATVGTAPYEGRMLLLPSGEVLFSNGTPSLQVYQPDGAPEPAWRPFVTACPAEIARGSAYRLEGTQLNGLSQACAYGDDAAMATNYPLVRLRSITDPDTVSYCRTVDHSTMAVATGAAPQSTSFVVPAGLPLGEYALSVVANGIASPERTVSVAELAAPFARATGERPSNRRELEHQHELFWRDLNEVHLLFDFVSGRSDRSLADLKGVRDRTADPGTPDMPPNVVVQRICEIRFPPVGSVESRAEQAAFLLTVKDRLNTLADPARGLSVAYTSMFAGIALSPRTLRAWIANWSSPNETGRHQFSFAQEAYPNLVGHARRFKLLFDWLPWLAFFWAIITALTYWDVALSGATLQAAAKLDADYAAQVSQAGFSEAACRTELPPGTDQTAACSSYHRIMDQQQVAARSLLRLFHDHTGHPVALVVHWLGSLPVAMAAPPPTRQAALAGGAGTTIAVATANLSVADLREAASVQLATDVVSVFTTYIVPMMFGLLGTLAGLVRLISAKVRESTLSPRDYKLTLASLPLGLVAGLAVGLLPLGGPNGAVSLSAAALAFLAGYGADAFFTMLDSLLRRVFVQENVK